jgi:hypothetical protein
MGNPGLQSLCAASTTRNASTRSDEILHNIHIFASFKEWRLLKVLRRVALVRTDISEEFSASISSETSVLTRAERRHIQEDVILHSHRRENLISYSHLSFN